MRRGTPKPSMACMARGRAASDDAVENAISHDSRTAFQKATIGMRKISATGMSTASTNTSSAPYSVSTRIPRLRRTPIPLCPTVTAMAAPMPNGANDITMPTNLNITSPRLSANPRITFFGPAGVRASATAKMMDQNTTCSTSFLAAASTKLDGTMCSSTPPNVTVRCDASVTVADTCADVSRPTPSPGRTRLTAIRPTASANVVTTSKYTIERNASRPTFFMSSPCPAIPTTSVENSSGAINDLIMLRKIVESGLRVTAMLGASQPSSTPRIIERMIHCVSEIRRTELAMSREAKGRLGWNAGALSVERRWAATAVPEHRVAVPVQEVDNEANRQPDTKPNPRHCRQLPHQVEARHDGNDRRERDTRYPEWTWTVRLRASEEDHARRY